MSAAQAEPRPLLRAALDYARRGWPVFPILPGHKRPAFPDHTEDHCTRSDPRCADGHQGWEPRATTDPDRIRRGWSTSPFNVGIACGPSGLVVIDLDKPKPGEQPPPEWADQPGIGDGADVFAALCERHGQPFPFGTFTVTTRRGGMHLYFTAPPDVALRNTNGRHRTGLGWLIDTRAAGGYVVAPGSFVDLPDGAGPYEIAHDVPPAPLPEWVVRLLVEARTPAPAPLGAYPSRPAGVADLPAYVQAALKGEADRVSTAVTGGRNHALNKAAYNLGRLVGAGLVDTDTATAVLYDAASVHFGPTDDDVRPAEARATIRSALAAGARKPRHVTTRGTAA